MHLVDANVLLYALNEDTPQHAPARRWLDDELAGTGVVAFTWIVVLAFLRLVTSAAVFERPLDVDTAVEVVGGWMSQPGAVLVEPTDRHLAVLGGLLRESGSAANLVNDAHLAALAVEHRATIVSFDRDFSRFAGVRTMVPGA